MFGAALFRRAETDGIPVMVVTLGERQVALALRSLQREFGIEDDTPDGRMLGLIAAALDFVSVVRIGDALPLEVCTGEASWEPSAMHLTLASTRLRMQLVAWLTVGSTGDEPEMNAESLMRVADDPAMRRQMRAALDHAATMLGLANQDVVVQLLVEMAQRSAFIETLRERLQLPVQAVAKKIDHLVHAWRRDDAQMENLAPMRRLTELALKEIKRRFDLLDAQTGEVIATLRNAKSQRAFIRSNRNWLYCGQRAWQATLDEWDTAGAEHDEGTCGLLSRTCRFLAPRFMPVTEWLSPAGVRRVKKPAQQMTW